MQVCIRCNTPYQARHAFQRSGNCSLGCFMAERGKECASCGGETNLVYAAQVLSDGRVVCSAECKNTLDIALKPSKTLKPKKEVRRIAVLNQKGGTGKTTTAINLAAGLADRGASVLLIDTDAQGNVGVSLGIHSEKNLKHILLGGESYADVVVPLNGNLDVIVANSDLAEVEIAFAQSANRAGAFSKAFGEQKDYDFILFDCGPALSLMNQHILSFADEVLVPVACEYLSLVGLKQLMTTVQKIRNNFGHQVQVGAVLPTFFDTRMRTCHEALESMRSHFGERCLHPIRVSVRLKESPRAKKTIFEHAPNSDVAEDYRRVVDWASGGQRSENLLRVRAPKATNTVPVAGVIGRSGIQ